MSDSEVADLFARVRHSVVSDNYSRYFYSLFIHSAFITSMYFSHIKLFIRMAQYGPRVSVEV